MQMTFHVINTISGHLGGTYREIEKVNDNLKAYLKIVCSNYNYLLYCLIFKKIFLSVAIFSCIHCLFEFKLLSEIFFFPAIYMFQYHAKIVPPFSSMDSSL